MTESMVETIVPDPAVKIPCRNAGAVEPGNTGGTDTGGTDCGRAREAVTEASTAGGKSRSAKATAAAEAATMAAAETTTAVAATAAAAMTSQGHIRHQNAD
jgi:hypothetical protein